MCQFLTQLLLLLSLASVARSVEKEEDTLYKIEGKVTPPDVKPPNWLSHSTVTIDGGRKRAFLKEDNSFVFQGLPSGTYLVELEHPDYLYEPVRVDINSKGKHRARKNNFVQPNQVAALPYPVKMKPQGKYRYFQKREEWKVTDVLFNPMVMMMVLPLLLVTVLPKMMQDPDTKKEMEEIQAKMNVQNNINMPEVSELLTSFLGGGTPAAKPKKRVTEGRPARR